LERNFVTPFGEADIIAYKRGMYVFVEVKTRESDIFGLPSEAVDRRKRQKYVAIAEFYCLQGGRELLVRFDVASVYDGKILEYIESAFERESEF